MNPLWAHLIGVFTLLTMLTFIGIWIWAWNARHAATFARLARVPLANEPIDALYAQDVQP